jgi:chaperonin cofactor prefoldin
MNLDERLEALTQSLELLASLQKDSDARIGRLTAAIEALARIAEIHEHRLSELEGGQ